MGKHKKTCCGKTLCFRRGPHSIPYLSDDRTHLTLCTHKLAVPKVTADWVIARLMRCILFATSHRSAAFFPSSLPAWSPILKPGATHDDPYLSLNPCFSAYSTTHSPSANSS